MDPHTGVQPIPIRFLLVFVPVLWLTVTTLGGAVSGWFSLRRAYPDSAERGRLLLARSPLRSSLGSGVTFTAYERGLRMHVLRVLRPHWRPIFIPWSDVSVFESTSRFARFFARTSLSFSRSQVMVSLPNDDGDLLLRVAPGGWAKRPRAD